MKPWFDAFVGTRAGAGKDAGSGGEAKLFAKLVLSLLHLEQNVEMPETNLVVHPVLQQAVELVSSPFL